MKKFLSLILVAVMLIGVVPMTYAAGYNYTVGDYVQFGSYPQSEVKDTDIISALNDSAPDWDAWTSYDYYSGSGDHGTMVQGDWMRYTDVAYNGMKYRGVMFTQYRPRYTYGTDSANEQGANGYETNTIYWFAFEPLTWRVLDSRSGFIVCDSIIDAQPYSNTIFSGVDYYYNDAELNNYASDYVTSSIREWLNSDFYNAAFTDSEKDIIMESALENSGYYTSIGTPGYEDFDSYLTTDKVFLLSYKEISTSKYGFSQDAYGRDAICKLQGSDYAKSQGLSVFREKGSKEEGNSSWILRSPGINSHRNCGVYVDGYASTSYYVYNTNYGICPAVKLNSLSSIEEHEHYYESEVTKVASHIAEGEITYICRCCGDTYTEVVPIIAGHTYESRVSLPTCSERGYRTYVCVCGDYYITNYVSAVDHKDSDGDFLCDYECGYEFPQPEPDNSEEAQKRNFFMNIIEWIKDLVQKILDWVGI